MKQRVLFLLVILMAGLNSMAQDNKKQPDPTEQIRQYWFVMLLAGPSRNQDSATAANIQKGHLDNINRLYYEGKIKVAGPFGDRGNWLGIFIFDCETRQEVESLLKTDPAISSGRLTYDIRPWWTAPTGSFTPGKPK
ncbi:YciI family protein [Flavihumibacter stibioxidans]|uniref:YCII-related domain-containing protein n=1 Tax=Flavihumibacter stibioxidans TaxID=1834163 RepID=A0ABR7MC73_9BACT|nr:YciI family protein [Flavihumibacter stibioxidans]MBC6492562.1 hypothetical protein [Flavihumibacter stibioxidans]